MSISYVQLSDHMNAEGRVDWGTYGKAKVLNGEECHQCRAFIYPPAGFRTLCPACLELRDETGEVTHNAFVRCPYCGTLRNPSEAGLYDLDREEHEVDCYECDKTFQVRVEVQFKFTSPKREPQGIDEEDD